MMITITSNDCLPCEELREILLSAYSPCAGFSSGCQRIARWSPSEGHIPRGSVGALGSLDEIQLVLLVAEPGNPQWDEQYPEDLPPVETLAACCRFVYSQFEDRRDLFHRNIRYILDLCWPGLSLRDQLRKTWISETVLCSATKEGGNVPVRVQDCCRDRLLRPQLELLKDRAVVALGSKAQRRSKGFPNVLPAYSAAPSGCCRRAAKPSWERIPGHLEARGF